eukprot:COSAG06_NODE_213_length_20138_cov_13.586295_8_plen_67_part_00
MFTLRFTPLCMGQQEICWLEMLEQLVVALVLLLCVVACGALAMDVDLDELLSYRGGVAPRVRRAEP